MSEYISQAFANPVSQRAAREFGKLGNRRRELRCIMKPILKFFVRCNAALLVEQATVVATIARPFGFSENKGARPKV